MERKGRAPRRSGRRGRRPARLAMAPRARSRRSWPSRADERRRRSWRSGTPVRWRAAGRRAGTRERPARWRRPACGPPRRRAWPRDERGPRELPARGAPSAVPRVPLRTGTPATPRGRAHSPSPASGRASEEAGVRATSHACRRPEYASHAAAARAGCEEGRRTGHRVEHGGVHRPHGRDRDARGCGVQPPHRRADPGVEEARDGGRRGQGDQRRRSGQDRHRIAPGHSPRRRTWVCRLGRSGVSVSVDGWPGERGDGG